ncbi:hypothetical protein Micbo1qcDRAFT_192820 [Microdochium bolleyi]|uniref:Hepatocellular carcinoma-associated antigen 59-domain-containing protein n=1 Tax=Microdochium bolleyi TaxID=196109 RepID=A0A136JFK3_9PEZI|nr:hypothetical protein Micbo1qcDRAFT_192820 [Microdochium bolleyi]
MDATEPAADAPVQPQVVFRGKKRKAYRQRADAAEATTREATSIPPQDAATNESAIGTPEPTEAGNGEHKPEEPELSVAELLRRRNARKARLGGVTFGSDATSRGDESPDLIGDELSLMIREEENKMQDATSAANGRFVHQTGLAKEVADRHMTEFIEAELAKRYISSQPKSATSSAGASVDGTRAAGATVQAPVNPAKQDKHTSLHGKISEVDLGDEVRARNEAMTERARRLAAGESLEDLQGGGPAKKIRLGRDGKPWRPRNRRDSDAIARDQLVEELMRENRVDIFEKPASAEAQHANNDDDELGADERIAEEFKRDFLEAMSQRRQARKRTVPTNAPRPGPKKPDGEVLKGPKLGGSRNARAAMRDILLKQQEAAKKG